MNYRYTPGEIGQLNAEIERLKEQLSHAVPAIEQLTKEREEYRTRWLASEVELRLAGDFDAVERLRSALKPFATAAECAYRGAGDAAAGLGLWMPLKFLDAAKDALAFTSEQSGDKHGS